MHIYYKYIFNIDLSKALDVPSIGRDNPFAAQGHELAVPDVLQLDGAELLACQAAG
jgi:hypothetical protein